MSAHRGRRAGASSLSKLLLDSFCCFRFATDSNLGGTEKLSVSLPIQGMMKSRPSIGVSEISNAADADKMILPMNILFVKGWSRSLAALCVLAAMYENEALFKASYNFFTNQPMSFSFYFVAVGFGWSQRARGPRMFFPMSSPVYLCHQRSFRAIHGAVIYCQPGQKDALANLVARNRGRMLPLIGQCLRFFLAGFTTKDTSIRRRPNAFNLYYQLQLMKEGQEEFEEVGVIFNAHDLFFLCVTGLVYAEFFPDGVCHRQGRSGCCHEPSEGD